jgi:protein involved in polysaccharide export with SLBB domain
VFQFDTRPSLVELLARAGGMPQGRAQESTSPPIMGRCLARILTPAGKNEIHDLSKLLETGDASEPVMLSHGSTVIIEWNRFEEITVVGRIQTTVIYRPGMRLLEALALAGGVDDEKTQNIKSVRILRRLPDGKIQRLDVNLHDLIHRGQVNRDIALEPGDYIVVPKRSERHTFFSTLRDLLTPVVQIGVLGTVF